jgi:hypothetical protein
VGGRGLGAARKSVFPVRSSHEAVLALRSSPSPSPSTIAVSGERRRLCEGGEGCQMSELLLLQVLLCWTWEGIATLLSSATGTGRRPARRPTAVWPWKTSVLER